MQDKLLTPREVAERLGCSESKLEADRAAGRGLPYVKLSLRMIRYRDSTVEQEINQATVQPVKRRRRP